MGFLDVDLKSLEGSGSVWALVCSDSDEERDFKQSCLTKGGCSDSSFSTSSLNLHIAFAYWSWKLLLCAGSEECSSQESWIALDRMDEEREFILQPASSSLPRWSIWALSVGLPLWLCCLAWFAGAQEGSALQQQSLKAMSISIPVPFILNHCRLDLPEKLGHVPCLPFWLWQSSARGTNRSVWGWSSRRSLTLGYSGFLDKQYLSGNILNCKMRQIWKKMELNSGYRGCVPRAFKEVES